MMRLIREAREKAIAASATAVQPAMVQPAMPPAAVAVVAGTLVPAQPMEMRRDAEEAESSNSTKAAAPAGGQLPDDEAVEGEDAISKLKRLKELLDLGAISQAEFDEKKAPLMSRI